MQGSRLWCSKQDIPEARAGSASDRLCDLVLGSGPEFPPHNESIAPGVVGAPARVAELLQCAE